MHTERHSGVSDLKTIFLLLFIILGLFMVVFPQFRIDTGSILDLRPYYTISDVYKLLSSYSAAQRASYRLFSSTADMVFPLTYGFFYFFLLRWLTSGTFAGAEWIGKKTYIAFGGPIFDILENIGIIIILTLYPVRSPFWAGFAAVSTVGKWFFTAVFLFLVTVAVILRIRGYRQQTASYE